jgi:SAM-dependent methyltransferase
MAATIFRRGFESVRDLGLRRTFETVMNHVEDRLFDVVNRTDTYAKVQQSELSVDSVHQGEAAPYFPTRGRAYRKALAYFALPTNGGFVDLGSGKGKILILSARYGFKRVVGVEFARQLSDVAHSNIDRTRSTLNGAEVMSVCADVTEYRFKPDDTVFFMFAPFGANVMRAAMTNLQRSLDEHPRRIWLIYTLPQLLHVITDHLGVREQDRYAYGGHDFVLLSNSV